METEENNFLLGNRNLTQTDVKLADCYRPLLVELAQNEQEMTFSEFVEFAKQRYPKVEEVQSAIPVSTGRRLEALRLYTKSIGAPDLSSWIVSKSGGYSEDYLADFNPQKEREASTLFDWSSDDAGWGLHVVEVSKATRKLKRRKDAEARQLMSDYMKDNQHKIPNPKKIPLSEITKHYRDPVLEGLKEGKDVEEVIADACKDLFGANENI